jgi:hypothetical protein
MRALGRLPARVDPRTLRARHYVDLAAAPAKHKWSVGVDDWPMYGNDKIGDCTIAAIGHMYECWSHVVFGKDSVIRQQSILDAYCAVSGYVPGDKSTDRGAVELDVLDYWRKVGVGHHTIEAFAAVNPRDHAELRAAIYEFGGVYVGCGLPISAQRQDVWSVVRGTDGAKWSWGGHAMALLDYDDRGVTFITWGGTQRATWEWVDKYTDEAYAVLASRWVDHYRSPTGIRLSELRRDLAAI